MEVGASISAPDEDVDEEVDQLAEDDGLFPDESTQLRYPEDPHQEAQQHFFESLGSESFGDWYTNTFDQPKDEDNDTDNDADDYEEQVGDDIIDIDSSSNPDCISLSDHMDSDAPSLSAAQVKKEPQDTRTKTPNAHVPFLFLSSSPPAVDAQELPSCLSSEHDPDSDGDVDATDSKPGTKRKRSQGDVIAAKAPKTQKTSSTARPKQDKKKKTTARRKRQGGRSKKRSKRDTPSDDSELEGSEEDESEEEEPEEPRE